MEVSNQNIQPRFLLSQIKNNTGYWLGHLPADPCERFAGQTFECPEESVLDNIQVYINAVQQPGQVNLTLHFFDTLTKTWGPVISSAEVIITKKDQGHWVRFTLHPLTIQKGTTYAFRLQSHDALIAIGEAAWPIKEPFAAGREWTGDAGNPAGNFYTYFSLAFKVEIRA
jgi:hypothetical protein